MGPSASQRCAGRGGARRQGAAPNAVPGIRGRGTGRGGALPDPALAQAPAHPTLLSAKVRGAGPAASRSRAQRLAHPKVGALGPRRRAGPGAGSGRAVAPPGLQAALRRGRGRRRKEKPLGARPLRAMAPAPVLSLLLSAGEHVGATVRLRPARSLPGTWGGRTRAPRVRSSLSPQVSGPGRSGCPSSRRRPWGRPSRAAGRWEAPRPPPSASPRAAAVMRVPGQTGGGGAGAAPGRPSPG